MLAGNKVSGVPIDMQGGAGPSRVPGQITHEFEEAASAGKFWIEKVGGGRHGRRRPLGVHDGGAFSGRGV